MVFSRITMLPNSVNYFLVSYIHSMSDYTWSKECQSLCLAKTDL